MGRKPVIGLVGACLASVALSGCCDNCTWPGGIKKDTPPPVNGGSTAFNQQRPPQAGGAQGVGSATSGNVAGRNDAVASNPRPPADTYPTGRTIPPEADGGTGSVERASYNGADPYANRATPPTNTSTNFKDPSANALPPLGTPAAGGVPARPAPLSSLPPMASPSEPARPRVDDITVTQGGRSALVTPRVTAPATPAGPGTAAPADPLPPPASPPGTSFSAGASSPAADLPPVPLPAPPPSPTTAGYQKPSPPMPPPLPGGLGTAPGLRNPANMQSGAPNE